MKKFKKIFLMLLAAGMLLSTVACGSGDDDEEPVQKEESKDRSEEKDSEEDVDVEGGDDAESKEAGSDAETGSEEQAIINATAAYVAMFNKVEADEEMEDSDFECVPYIMVDDLKASVAGKPKEAIRIELSIPENPEISRDVFVQEMGELDIVQARIDAFYGQDFVMEDGTAVEVTYQLVKDGEVLHEGSSCVTLVKSEGIWYGVGFGGTEVSKSDFE